MLAHTLESKSSCVCMCYAESVRLQPHCIWSAFHDILRGITEEWDNLLRCDDLMSPRFGVVSYRSHSWMTLTSSDQLFVKIIIMKPSVGSQKLKLLTVFFIVVAS